MINVLLTAIHMSEHMFGTFCLRRVALAVAVAITKVALGFDAGDAEDKLFSVSRVRSRNVEPEDIEDLGVVSEE